MKKLKYIEQFSSWLVTEMGIIHFRIPPYCVGIDRIGESGWCYHISKKSWANVEDFEKALLFARKHFGIPEPKYGDWSEQYWTPPHSNKKVLVNESC